LLALHCNQGENDETFKRKTRPQNTYIQNYRREKVFDQKRAREIIPLGPSLSIRLVPSPSRVGGIKILF